MRAHAECWGPQRKDPSLCSEERRRDSTQEVIGLLDFIDEYVLPDAGQRAQGMQRQWRIQGVSRETRP